MNRIIAKLKHELVELVPTTLFFFFTFQLVAITRDLMLQQHGIYTTSFVTAAVGALLVAKVVVVMDHMAFMNRYPDKPLIYNVIWKTSLYIIAVLIVRYAESFIPFVVEYKDVAEAHHEFSEAIIWSRFWATQIWLTVLFLIYCALREFGRIVGRKRMLRLFFVSLDPHSS